MKSVIINIIRDGWKKNLPVVEVVKQISRETGLIEKYAQEQFVNLVFACKS